MNNSVIRAVLALLVGLVLVIWPDMAADYLVITIGVLFVIPGLLATINYFARRRKEAGRSRFPVEAVGSILFGIWLIVMPAFFANLLMYLLGVILILGGGQQLYSLIIARRWTRVHFGFFIVPSLILLAGVFVLFNPTNVRNTALIIIGVAAIVYALVELVNWFKFTNGRPKLPENREIVNVDIIEE